MTNAIPLSQRSKRMRVARVRFQLSRPQTTLRVSFRAVRSNCYISLSANASNIDAPTGGWSVIKGPTPTDRG